MSMPTQKSQRSEAVTDTVPDPVTGTGVRPSAPGSIDAWLDVLVSMLALPKPDRERVRDELEDHLRSRIDDLIITGHTEPEALKQAVSELGETADLARQLSHAHNPPRTRRTLMYTALIALAGSTLTLGIMNMRPAAPTLLPESGESLPESNAAMLAADSHEPDAHDALVNLRGTTLETIIDTIKSLADRPVLVHWDRIEGTGIERDEPVDFDVDPLPLHVVRDLLIEHFSQVMVDDTLAMSESEDLYEISTQSHFDQRSSSRQIYPVVDILGSVGDALQTGGRRTQQADVTRQLTDVIQTHVAHDAWVDMGGSLASISAIDRALIVTAPQRIHIQIQSLLAEMRDEMRERERASIERQRRLASTLGAELERLKSEIRKIEDMQAFTQAKIQTMSLAPSKDAATINDMAMLEAERQRLQRQGNELDSRIRYIQTRLITAEYEPQMSGASSDAGSRSIRVQGLGDAVSAIASPPEGMTVRELIDRSSLNPLQQSLSVRVFRRGAFLVSINSSDIQSEGGQIQLLPGDTVSVGGPAARRNLSGRGG